ncbi:MAG TPA: ribonuclease P [Candidatus Bathyarchaeia archaeon]|nr:ribonuclease P [Candidatus Bathyarchaeia archaeon]
MTSRRRRKALVRDIVLQRIDRLLEMAATEFPAHPKRSDRYVELVWRLATRHRVPLKKKKMRFCRNCGAYFVYGTNARVRIKNKRIAITCLKCGDLRRY